jgi:hypothetical protein
MLLKSWTFHGHDHIFYVCSAVQEWSYIPVGGNLPMTSQRQLGFGAAASMVHPATGKWYVSVLRLQMLPELSYD